MVTTGGMDGEGHANPVREFVNLSGFGPGTPAPPPGLLGEGGHPAEVHPGGRGAAKGRQGRGQAAQEGPPGGPPRGATQEVQEGGAGAVV